MRLDKFLASNTNYSRKDIARLARQGRISLNGDATVKVSTALDADDVVCLDGEPIQAIHNYYLMLNKPAGYVCATVDSEHPTVLDLFERSALPLNRLQIVGRLDLETTGLLLLTSDGQWNHRITAPNSHCPKTYRVDTEHEIDEATIEQFAAGIMLRNEKSKTRPAALRKISAMQAEVTIAEGKYHQIRRMFAACGNQVSQLHRCRVGNLLLDPALNQGEYRALLQHEIDAVFD